SGELGSERMLARIYGVSRGTVREALRRLAARGLVVQRSARRARAVALDESLTLENLGLALHDEGGPECRRLLEGFFSLKRQVLVELLADCCARASGADLRPLEDACFRLWDAARWHPGVRCAQLEFELLRLAARIAERPGHLLLIQSLQWALRGNASRLLSLMGGEPLRQWTTCAMGALDTRDVRRLQHELPALLKACDERVLDDFAPVPQEQEECPEAQGTREGLLGDSTSATEQDEVMEARPCVEERGLGNPTRVHRQDEALETRSFVEERVLGDPTSVLHQDDAMEERPFVEERGRGGPTSVPHRDDAMEERPFVEERGRGDSTSVPHQDEAMEVHPCVGVHGPGGLAPATGDTEVLGGTPCPHGEALSMEADSGALLLPTDPGSSTCEPGGECTGGDGTDAALGILSDCRTDWGVSSPEGGLQPGTLPTDSLGQIQVAVPVEDEPLHETQGLLGRWAARLWRFIAHALGRPAS
ncbi:FadR/GntR family transcriptional regulator, partial [Corallococcus carmarthensis]|uniref:FadR/GntR family transcriptional regulator n=1 Tax=Corallococcus carmarthensis TaxID=2316728 RepID=UPI00148E1657